MSSIEMKITGFGGQGIILTGMLIGKAAAIYESKSATLIQSFGPEARGGACQAQVIVSDEQILYPYVRECDILLSLSQDAYNTYIPHLKKDGILIYEEDLVDPGDKAEGVKSFCIPSTHIAEELGRKIVANIVALGFFTAVTKLVKPESMKEAVKSSVPKGTIDLNLRAFDQGFKYFKNNQ
ncbi:2-oxoacid:acceptor oxidoreductase family protein [candidate division KSB1 bacterium]